MGWVSSVAHFCSNRRKVTILPLLPLPCLATVSLCFALALALGSLLDGEPIQLITWVKTNSADKIYEFLPRVKGKTKQSPSHTGNLERKKKRGNKENSGRQQSLKYSLHYCSARTSCLLQPNEGLLGASRDGNWGGAAARWKQSLWLLFWSLILQEGHAKTWGGKNQPSWRELKGKRDGRGCAGSQPLAHREVRVLKRAQASGPVSPLLPLAS